MHHRFHQSKQLHHHQRRYRQRNHQDRDRQRKQECRLGVHVELTKATPCAAEWQTLCRLRPAQAVPDNWHAPCGGRFAARSASTTAAARSTPPTAPTTARCRSASFCPATSMTFSPPSLSAVNSAPHCSAAAAAHRSPVSAATSPLSLIFRSTWRRSSRLIPRAASLACNPESCSILCATPPKSITSLSHPIPLLTTAAP